MPTLAKAKEKSRLKDNCTTMARNIIRNHNNNNKSNNCLN
jgi:hypothetical protein